MVLLDVLELYVSIVTGMGDDVSCWNIMAKMLHHAYAWLISVCQIIS